MYLAYTHYQSVATTRVWGREYHDTRYHVSLPLLAVSPVNALVHIIIIGPAYIDVNLQE